MIYFLSAKTSDGRIKVGYTEDFSKRLSQIERANACRIDVIGVIAGTEEQEKELHEEIEEFRNHHEWYYDTPELREWIARQMYPESPSEVLPAPTEAVSCEFD